MAYFSPTDLKATAARAANTNTTLFTEEMAESHSKQAAIRSRAPEINFDVSPAVLLYKAAILPITDRGSFTRQEYFEVYPEVKDAGPNYTKPKALHLWDQGKWLGTWGRWVSDGRRW